MSPAYPYSARILFGKIRTRLAKELKEPMSFERLAEIIGKSKSTTYHWFDIYAHPHILAYMCLLERMPIDKRHTFIDEYCRVCPSFDDPSLSYAPAKLTMLWEVMNQKKGLTIITGGIELTRTFLIHAMGHSYRRIDRRPQATAGIDLHRPTHFVPVESFAYIDATASASNVMKNALKIWPKIQTSGASLMFFNGLWSAVPSLRPAILTCASKHHVIMADAGHPDLQGMQKIRPLRLLTISATKRFPARIRIDHQRIK